ncbi:MAG: aspartate kinase, partial [Leptolyngbya sp.]|nr:aspartate kinase [Candidatus Melainabacteria bacterium]
AVNSGYAVVAVASAMGDSTDDLLKMTNSFDLRKCKPELDILLASGEQLSTSLLTMALNSSGIQASAFTAAKTGIITDDTHGSASIRKINTAAIRECLQHDTVAVVAGYQGITDKQEITTLGRGGSDTTAVALAAALHAERCDIYTDVDGIYSADPRCCSTSLRLENVSLVEMLAMANAGAHVMCAQAMEIAHEKNLPLRVRSVFKPEDLGTLISSEERPMPFTGIASNSQQDVFVVHSGSSLKELSKLHLLLQNARELSMQVETVRRVGKRHEFKAYISVSNHYVQNAKTALEHMAEDLGLKMEHSRTLSKVSIIGSFDNTNDVLQRAWSTLFKHSIIPRFWSKQDGISLSVWLPHEEANQAIDILHEKFIHDSLKIPA